MFNLHGQKLKGEYALVKSSYQGENSWLLMKAKDKYAKSTDITKKDKSVISGKSIAAMEKNPDRVYGKNKDRSKKVKEPKAASSLQPAKSKKPGASSKSSKSKKPGASSQTKSNKTRFG